VDGDQVNAPESGEQTFGGTSRSRIHTPAGVLVPSWRRPSWSLRSSSRRSCFARPAQARGAGALPQASAPSVAPSVSPAMLAQRVVMYQCDINDMQFTGESTRS